LVALLWMTTLSKCQADSIPVSTGIWLRCCEDLHEVLCMAMGFTLKSKSKAPLCLSMMVCKLAGSRTRLQGYTFRVWEFAMVCKLAGSRTRLQGYTCRV